MYRHEITARIAELDRQIDEELKRIRDQESLVEPAGLPAVLVAQLERLLESMRRHLAHLQQQRKLMVDALHLVNSLSPRDTNNA